MVCGYCFPLYTKRFYRSAMLVFIKHNPCSKLYSFGHNEHYIAVVDWFGNPQLDTNSRLWFVPSREAAERSVIQIANLSQPLATAVDDDKLWFLNYSMS